MNSGLGTPVLEPVAGGRGGGGTMVAVAGKTVVERYRAIEAPPSVIATPSVTNETARGLP